MSGIYETDNIDVEATLKMHQAEISEKKAAKAAKEKELSRLRAARKRLNEQIDSYRTLRTRITSMKDHINKNNFKGDRRDKFDTKFEKVSTEANNYQNKHQSNLAQLNSKISDCEADLGDILGALGSLYKTYENLARSWF